MKCGNTQEYCLCGNCEDFRENDEDQCMITNVGGFLKYKCYNQQYQDHYKCARSDVRYKATLNWVDSRGINMISSTDRVCENDEFAYQACGFGTSVSDGVYLCEGSFNVNKQYEIEDVSQDNSGRCDGKCDTMNNCKDESYCYGKASGESEDAGTSIDFLYGLECTKNGDRKYAPVHWICNGVNGCDCEEGEGYGCIPRDEEDCDATEVEENREYCHHYYGERILNRNELIVPIKNFTRCAVFDIQKGVYPYCLDFYDQTNCNDEKRIGGICEVRGKKTRISKTMVCYDYDKAEPLCEGREETFCEALKSSSEECLVHKHQMCDRIPDCRYRSDELNDICKIMTGGEDRNENESFKCKRKFGNYQENEAIPVSWLLDGQEDCQNGEDENLSRWKKCKTLRKSDNVNITYVVSKDTECEVVFLCDKTAKSTDKSVRLDIMCDGVESCGQDRNVENEVCRFSRDFPNIENVAPTSSGQAGDKTTDLCGDIAIKNKTINCERKEFDFPQAGKFKTFGVTKWLSVPDLKVDCTRTFGEFYVYLSCMGLCLNSSCPLPDTPLRHDACPTQYPDRIYTLAGDKDLTFVTKSEGQDYRNNYFQCAENKRCVEYSQVCDLTNDCGDWSDENNCTNQFRCKTSKSRKSLEQRCDGIIDCVDLSDECNEECGFKRILEHWSLRVICWLIGILATVFNLILMSRTAYSFRSIRTGNLFETKVLILVIAVGDFLNGIYMVSIAAYDTIVYGNSYCKDQARWLSSGACSALGAISTIGSQMSLFAMTVLSLTRVVGLTSKSMKTPSPVNKKAVMRTSIKLVVILASSATIALIPLVPSLEDYFVQGIYYEKGNNVFIGSPNKERHITTLRAYEGDDEKLDFGMAWKDIHEKVRDMFSSTTNSEYNTLSWRKVHFYGNDGHCLFKYFVRKDDARRSRQSAQVKTEVVDFIDFSGNVLLWVVLSVNFACFLVISISYLLITIQTWKSSSSSGQTKNQDTVKQNERIQLKISLIIATDFFCWVPFVIICAFHNFQFIDATDWYSYFSMIALPINSVINPLLYDNTITEFLVSRFGSIKTRASSFISSTYSRTSKIFKRPEQTAEVDVQRGGNEIRQAESRT